MIWSPRRATAVWGLTGLLLVLGGGAWASPAALGPVLVALRYDDYAGPPASGPDEDFAVEQELFAMCHRLGVVPAVAVIPDVTNMEGKPLFALTSPQAGPRVALLKELWARGEIEVAQHGLHHDYPFLRAPAPWISPGPSEFSTLPLAVQLQKIRAGRDLLASLLGRAPDLFVPPRNSYDDNTVRALEQSGFHTISGEILGAAAPDSKLAFVPSTTKWDEFEPSVANAARFPGPSIVVLVMHAYEMRDPSRPTGPTVADIEAALRRVQAVPGVRITSLRQIAADYPGLVTAAHLRAAVPSRWVFDSTSLWALSSGTLGRHLGTVYWPEDFYRRLRWVELVPAAAGLLFGTAMALMLAGIVRTRGATRRFRGGLAVAALLGEAGAIKWTLWLFTFRYWPFGPAHQEEAACALAACLVLVVLLLSRLRQDGSRES